MTASPPAVSARRSSRWPGRAHTGSRHSCRRSARTGACMRSATMHSHSRFWECRRRASTRSSRSYRPRRDRRSRKSRRRASRRWRPSKPRGRCLQTPPAFRPAVWPPAARAVSRWPRQSSRPRGRSHRPRSRTRGLPIRPASLRRVAGWAPSRADSSRPRHQSPPAARHCMQPPARTARGDSASFS